MPLLRVPSFFSSPTFFLALVLLLLSPLSFSRPFLRFEVKKAFGSFFRSNEEYPRCCASCPGFGLRFNYEPLKEAGQLLLRDRILKYFERSETFSFFYFSLLSNAYLRDCKTWIINLRFIIISLSKNIFHRATVAR